jgi:hypothetical protein
LTQEIPFGWHCLLNTFSKVFNDQIMWKISIYMRDLPKGFPVFIEYTFKPQQYSKFKLDSFEISADIDDSLFIFGTIRLSKNSRFSGSYTTRKWWLEFIINFEFL